MKFWKQIENLSRNNLFFEVRCVFLLIVIFGFSCQSHAQGTIKKFKRPETSSLYLPANVNSQLLMNSDDLSFFKNMLYQDYFGQFWMIKDSLMACADFSEDSLQMDFLKLPKEIKQCRELLWLNSNSVIMLDGDTMKTFDKESVRNIVTLPYTNMNLASATDTSFYVFGKTTQNENVYVLFLYNLNGSWLKICELPDAIHSVLGDGIFTLVASGKKIYVLDYITGANVLHSGDDEILSLAATADGTLLFSTSKTVNYNDDFQQTYAFSNMGASKLWCYGDDLYVLFLNNVFVKISPISGLKNFGDLIEK